MIETVTYIVSRQEQNQLVLNRTVLLESSPEPVQRACQL